MRGFGHAESGLNLTIQTQFRVMLWKFRPPVSELSMSKSLQPSVRSKSVPDRKLVGLAAICIACFLCVLPFASAQSQTTHYKSSTATHYTHYKSTRLPSVDQKPHSVPSSVALETGKSGRGAMSPNKELDQLERAGAMKPMGVKSAASRAPAKSTLAPEKHSAPINFTHRELPQGPHSAPAKIR